MLHSFCYRDLSTHNESYACHGASDQWDKINRKVIVTSNDVSEVSDPFGLQKMSHFCSGICYRFLKKEAVCMNLRCHEMPISRCTLLMRPCKFVSFLPLFIYHYRCSHHPFALEPNMQPLFRNLITTPLFTPDKTPHFCMTTRIEMFSVCIKHI